MFLRTMVPLLACWLWIAGCPTRSELGTEGSSTALAEFGSRKEIVDPDYRFRLTLPGPGWTLLDEQEVTGLYPDAIAGAIRSSGGAGVIVAEPVGQTDLRSIVESLAENMPLQHKQISPCEPIEFQGKEALRFQVTGESRGIAFRYQDKRSPSGRPRGGRHWASSARRMATASSIASRPS